MARSKTTPSTFRSRSARTRLGVSASLLTALAAAHGLATAQPATAQAPAGNTSPAAASPPAASASAPPSTQLAPITVTGRAAPVASVSGWGDIPLVSTPLQATVLSASALRDAGATRLADVTTLDPGVSDAYNAEGYVDYLTVRGYVLDNRFNFRRDGLPINAETSIPLENKAAIEVLKGTSGLQSGTSAPGGLVNFVVKRPGDTPVRSVFLEWRQPGMVTGAVDLAQRFGVDAAFGLRLNAAAAHLDSMVRSSEGNRQVFALAGDWRLGRDSLIEAEVETSHRSQPSQPGFSLLGDRVPSASAIDPRINLNDQPWSQPVVFHATTASLRWTQRLAGDWRLVVHGATQRLRNDDRLAYPYGCTESKDVYYGDRYCPNGNFDLYDFRSENERRRNDALDVSVQGTARTAGLVHTVRAGVLQSRVRNRFEGETYNYAGTGNIDGTLVTQANPEPLNANTNRDEHSTELHVQDAIDFGNGLTAWLGARTTRLHRQSIGTDGSDPTDYAKTFTTPSVALSYAWQPGQLVYASWGRGVESNVVSSNPRYTNRDAIFTAMSRQAEIGIKGASDAWDWNVAAFDIQRPQTRDVGACSGDASCTTVPAGNDRHRGVEADAGWRSGPWSLRGGVQLLRARVEGSGDPTLDGKRPTNVPAQTFKAQAAYDLAAVPGLALLGNVVRESRREVLPDNSVSIPGWTRFDAALRDEARVGSVLMTWRVGVDNVFDRRAWRESPYQYSHVYLYPLAPRTFRLSLQIDL